MTTKEIMDSLIVKIDESISKFPYYSSYISTLGGEENASILFTVGLDKKETWAHNIFENSRYVRYHVHRRRDGIELECFQFRTRNNEIKKFRRVTSTSDKIIERLNKDLKIISSII